MAQLFSYRSQANADSVILVAINAKKMVKAHNAKNVKKVSIFHKANIAGNA